MVAYTYRCSACGDFDVAAPMGSAEQQVPCPRCAAEARRVFTVPRLARSAADPRMRLIDETKRSAAEPRVVESLPTGGVRHPQPVTRDPRHASLPRPAGG